MQTASLKKPGIRNLVEAGREYGEFTLPAGKKQRILSRDLSL